MSLSMTLLILLLKYIAADDITTNFVADIIAIILTANLAAICLV